MRVGLNNLVKGITEKMETGDIDYSRELFSNYRKAHIIYTRENDDGRYDQFKELYKNSYEKYFKGKSKNARILEIGCNVGTMLKVLAEEGYKELEGIDLSPDDLKIASHDLPTRVHVEYADAFDYLKEKMESYDVIYSKAVFEHIKKEKVNDLLKLCKKALKMGGILLIDVPNMDWLLAYHERYMDFTHECGYNSNSLGQIMRNTFGNCEIRYANDLTEATGLKGKIARKVLYKLINWSIPCLEEEALFSRQVIGVSKKRLN